MPAQTGTHVNELICKSPRTIREREWSKRGQEPGTSLYTLRCIRDFSFANVRNIRLIYRVNLQIEGIL